MVASSTVLEVTDATFDAAVIAGSRGRPVVVDFWAGWCTPCRALRPILEQAVTRHGGVTLATLDVDANPAVTARYGVQGIPAVKGFRDGTLVAAFTGLLPRVQVERFLDELAPAPPPPPLPADEPGLRAAIAAQPGDPTPRRALGALLLETGRLDEADAVLAASRDDRVCDGLRARIEICRDGDPELAALAAGGDGADALRRMISAIRGSDGTARARLRRAVVGSIAARPQGDPATDALRAELATALF
jgi:putative thioredoxin